jgi:hypothetical protein
MHGRVFQAVESVRRTKIEQQHRGGGGLHFISRPTYPTPTPSYDASHSTTYSITSSTESKTSRYRVTRAANVEILTQIPDKIRAISLPIPNPNNPSACLQLLSGVRGQSEASHVQVRNDPIRIHITFHPGISISSCETRRFVPIAYTQYPIQLPYVMLNAYYVRVTATEVLLRKCLFPFPIKKAERPHFVSTLEECDQRNVEGKDNLISTFNITI